MHRKKVLAGLFLTAGLTLTLLTPRNILADDVLPDSGIAQVQLITPEALSVSVSPGSLAAPEDDDDSGGGSTQGDMESPAEAGEAAGPQMAESPGEPEAPAAPVEPEVPAAPAEPEVPAAPAAPEVPAEPAAPVEPEVPAEPAAPAAPEEPAAPVDPGEPEGPVDPADPGEPEGPVDPADPGEPGGTVDPADPGKPEGPVDPVNPGKPEGPAAPVDPGEPAAPDEPEEPTESVEPQEKTEAKTAKKQKLLEERDSQNKLGAPSPEPVSETASRLTTFPNASGFGAGINSGFSRILGGQGKYTARFVKVAKVFAIPKGSYSVAVREEMSASSRTIGTIPKGGLVFILWDEDEKWLYIESGDVRGFVLRDLLKTGDEVTRLVKQKGEGTFAEAETLVDPSENKALTYTRTTVYDSKELLTELRAAIIEKSEEYLGGPYVWGGTSLTGGCDCSGFIQSLFGLFGVELPRTSREQATAGDAIPLSEVEPGDLVFYATDGIISHVMMAIGDGLAINAANSRSGIIISDIDENRVVKACRVLESSDGFASAADGASYTEDQLELIWAIVAQEDDTCYEGALAVISCAMNRADRNYGGYGTTALSQLTADGQFCYSPKISDPSLWMRRLGGSVPEFVKTAVSDCLTKGIRNNGYLNFRSSNRNGISVPIGCNWFF